MKKILMVLGVILFSSFFLVSCENSKKEPIDATGIVGTYKSSVSKNMGGYNISASKELRITRDGPGDYKYQLSTTLVDQMYGGIPKLTNSSGTFKKEINNHKWEFEGGEIGNSGGYLNIRSGGWPSPPKYITIFYPSGHGNPMEFERY